VGKLILGEIAFWTLIFALLATLIITTLAARCRVADLSYTAAGYLDPPLPIGNPLLQLE